jgi:threonine dehydratase
MERKRRSSSRTISQEEGGSETTAALGGPTAPKRERRSDGPVLQYQDVTAASFRIRRGVRQTPLKKSEPLSAMLGLNIFFKKEFTLPTGSFKERGARNTLELLSEVCG